MRGPERATARASLRAVGNDATAAASDVAAFVDDPTVDPLLDSLERGGAYDTLHAVVIKYHRHATFVMDAVSALVSAGGSPDAFRAALHPRTRYQPPQTLVSAEQTANIGGGTIWKKADLDEVVKIAKASGLATHMDGARLQNATVATGIGPRDMTEG